MSHLQFTTKILFPGWRKRELHMFDAAWTDKKIWVRKARSLKGLFLNWEQLVACVLHKLSVTLGQEEMASGWAGVGFRLAVRDNFLTERAAQATGESPALEGLKRHLDVAFGDMEQGWVGRAGATAGLNDLFCNLTNCLNLFVFSLTEENH